jgi:anti-sigma B factor antagonist
VDHEELQPLVTVGISRDRESALVSFSGELDIFTAPNMRQAFLDPEVTGASKVQVDLTQASFFDSSAVGVIVAACRRVREKDGGVFGVTCPDGIVRRILEISGLIEYLQVVPVAS